MVPQDGPGVPDNAEFADALRAAMDSRGLTLDRIRFHLRERGHDVSLATLSYWRSGRSRPERASSLASLGALEELLRVPRGSLARTLPPNRRRPLPVLSPIAAPGQKRPLHDETVDALAAGLGLEWGWGLERLSVHDLIDIQADRRTATHVVREVVRATEERVERFPVYYNADDPGSTPDVLALRNCHRGRTARDEERGIIVAELILDPPLRGGDAVPIEYELAVTGLSTDRDGWERGVLRNTREVMLEVSFAPEALPTSFSEHVLLNGVQTRTPRRLRGNRLDLLATDFGPGLFGGAWSWDAHALDEQPVDDQPRGALSATEQTREDEAPAGS